MILIVEDDDTTARALQAGLTGAGYSVARARSADDALHTLESTHADLIFLSLMLPDTDGLILCATLKACSPAPVIVLTPRASDVDRALALASGAIDWLTKPVDRDELLARVDCALG